MERPHAPSINRRSLSRDCFRESAPIIWGPRTRRSPRAPNEPGLRGRWHAALLNRVTSKGPLNRAHTYNAAVVATAQPDATPTTATRSRRAGRDRCFDDGSSRHHDVFELVGCPARPDVAYRRAAFESAVARLVDQSSVGPLFVLQITF